MNEQASRIWPVILSGGAGTRLWPLSRAASPKQLLALAGPQTMLATTAARVADPARFHPPLVVTGAAHVAVILEQLGAATDLIVEPMARNTAPAIALALLAVAAHDPDSLMLVMPSDHRLALPGALLDAAIAATPAALEGWLVTFGIRAERPETGYGYIRAGAALAGGLREVTAFIEKPERARAESFIADGGHSWNSGIFLFSVKAMLAALKAHAPAVLTAAGGAMAAARRDGRALWPGADAFAAAPSISIDHAVFEHAAKIAVCPIDAGWSDIGSWDALHGLGVADARGNVAQGRIESIDTNNCLLRAENTILATIGVANLNIIATPDAVLVTARGRSEEVRAVAARLAGDPVLDRPVIEVHDWGEMHVVHDGDGLKVRKVRLRAGASVGFGPPRTAAGTSALLVSGSASADGEPLVAGRLTRINATLSADRHLETRSDAVLILID